MSMHYAKYASTGCRVEYIGRKPRNDCIKTIQVRGKFEQTDFLLFSPDGTHILSSLERVCVWEATSGELVAGPLMGDDETGALSAAYLPDGRYVIVVGRDGVYRKWDVLMNRLVWEREIEGGQIDLSQVVSAVFSPDRKLVVFGNSQGTILVLNVDTGKQDSKPLKGHTSSVSCLSFSPDGKHLVSGSRDMTIIIWDMSRRGANTGPLRGHTQRVTTVNFSPSGDNIISGSRDGTILVWNAFTGEVLREIICMNKVYSVTYSPDGLFILAGGNQWMSMWNVADVATPPKAFQVDFGEIWRLSFSPDSSRFVSVAGHDVRIENGVRTWFEDNKLQIWDASWRMEETKTTFKAQGQIWSVALSPCGKFAASGSADGSIYLWDVLSGEFVKKLKFACDINSVAFSPINEKLIAFGLEDSTVQLWDVTNDEPVVIGNHMESVYSVAFSFPDGKKLSSGSMDKTIRIWNIERRELEVGPLIGHEHFVMTVAYSPDGKRLVSGSVDSTVRIWNSETGQLLSILKCHSDCVSSVAYSFDGSRIVSASFDKTILVWNAQSGQIVCGSIIRHERDVTSVCFSLDGRRILSGSDDKTACVWDAVTGKPLFPPFRGHTFPINSVYFFPDGRRFATGSNDRTIRIWTLGEAPNDTNWGLKDDGWVVGKNGELMMWIPTDLRRYLCSQRNISVLNSSFYFKLHFCT